jgi:hypothetical protein
MAEVTRTGNPTLASPRVDGFQLAGARAGADLIAGDVVYMNTDGLVYPGNGAAANAAARVIGMVEQPTKSGEVVTVWFQGRFAYGPNVGGTPSALGALLYLSGTVAGGLADAPSTGGTVAIAWVVDADGRIQLKGLS